MEPSLPSSSRSATECGPRTFSSAMIDSTVRQPSPARGRARAGTGSRGGLWEALRRAGVEDFSLETSWRQYRMSMLFSLLIMVLGAEISGAANGWTAGTSKSPWAG